MTTVLDSPAPVPTTTPDPAPVTAPAATRQNRPPGSVCDCRHWCSCSRF